MAKKVFLLFYLRIGVAIVPAISIGSAKMIEETNLSLPLPRVGRDELHGTCKTMGCMQGFSLVVLR